jgi:nitrate/nitrite transport system permease protein
MHKPVPAWHAALLSLALLALFLGAWEIAVRGSGSGGVPVADAEYAALLGQAAAAGGQTAMPAPSDIGARLVELLSDPFHRRGTNDQGIGIQIAYSLWRVAAGFGLAMIVAIPLGFLIGMSPLLNAALNPFIQVLRPVSPLAWMPLALYTIKDSSISSIFVIFICSIWPMLLNTAFGVASVRREWLNVASTLEAGRWRTAMRVILPAAAPTILTGMRISLGIAWLVIVAAEMLVGGTGIGYWVWNQWNNLSIADIVIAILMIGLVGLLLDRALGWVANAVAWQE